jgi:RNA polymerase sigma-70 factor (ECF subfamily)
METSDADLVRRALGGDREAFDALALRHRPSLLRAAALLIGDADEAENLTQEALTRAYAGLAGYRDDLPFGPWLHGIVLNLCRHHIRDRGRRARPVDPECLGGAADPSGRREGVLSAVLRREWNDRAISAISQLPEAYREAFVLHYIEDLGYQEISRITGVAGATLRVRARRARLLLRENLGAVVDTWIRRGADGAGPA